MLGWTSWLLVALYSYGTGFPQNQQEPRAAGAAIDNQSYRLPENIVPSKYVVDLSVPKEVFSGVSTIFTGSTEIRFKPVGTVESNEIKLHKANGITINSMILQSGPNNYNVESFSNYDEATEIVTILTKEKLIPGQDFVLTIKFTGELQTTSMYGFYRSSYQNKDGTTEYLVTTQFESTLARKAFPCFDEPHLKASFVIRLTYPKGLGLNALSNMESTIQTNSDDTETAEFKETPVMSTYLVAFAISKFTCTEGTNIDLYIKSRVCSRPESETDRELAVKISTPLMQALEKITGIKYGLKMTKMDQIAIPDFNAGAMENWGLVTYRETALLWNSKDSPNIYKQKVITTVAHEFTHMWFGNLVTLKWWDYAFLNEGFARYFQYFAAMQIEETKDWELDKQFVTEQVHTAFVADSKDTSKALSHKSVTPTEIATKFDTVSYNKGASVIRMVEHFLGKDKFLEGIKDYLNTHASKNTVPDDLWDSFSKFVTQGILPENTTLHSVMNNWINEPGYPVVTVTLQGNDVVLSQSRFLFLQSHNTNTEWYVPVSYTLSSDTNKFSDAKTRTWITPGQKTTLSGVLEDNNQWIILNNQQTGYYRVNYDTNLWNRIKTQLLTNHSSIDVLNRAQIVGDVINFARAGLMPYSQTLDIISYIKNDVDYYPWYVTINGLDLLFRRIDAESTAGKKLAIRLLDYIEKSYRNVPFEAQDDTKHIHTLKQVAAFTAACKYGHNDCIEKTKQLFKEYKTGTPVPKNFRGIVYCNALRHSENPEADFKFLWSKLVTSTLATEIDTIITGLGCTKNDALLNWYLEQSINSTSGIRLQNVESVWASVYRSSTLGVHTALEFLDKIYDRVQKYYSNTHKIVTNLADYVSTDEGHAKLLSLSKRNDLHESTKQVVEQALKSVAENVLWAKSIRGDLESYLDSITEYSSGRSVQGLPIMVISICIILARLFLHSIMFT